MTFLTRPGALALLLCAAAFAGAAPAAAPFTVPVEYHKLDNGLRVVLSRDTTAPKAVVAVYYNIGFRIEPQNRTGFAHLFEHMMFQGSQNLGKMEFIKLVQANGGVLNGSTRFDFTNYFEIVPSHALETALWAEADRMRGLAITGENLTNQQGVVKSEVRVNVLNRPYGGFPWLDMPQYANVNWHNAHNFYGDLKDLDAATLEDVNSFFMTYYVPSNAVLVVTGDFESAPTLAKIRELFGKIPSPPKPVQPDISEPKQEKEKRATKQDALATRPALAFAYHAPLTNSAEYYAMGLLEKILLSGKDSTLYQALVQRTGLTGDVNGGINSGLGNMFNIQGPTLLVGSLFYDRDKSADQILKVVDEEIEKLRSAPLEKAVLDRAIVKIRSDLYDAIESTFGFGRADLLGSFALFYDDPNLINGLEERFRKITPELVQKTAREYLAPSNRTVLLIEPKADAPSDAKPDPKRTAPKSGS
ncbi:MAG: insulinase family protein [Acidobacteria bacterium]|nr:insulinase family protein [Acidobacteriota bacterium]MCA1611944.1 insulinase family protein [Acidobacteriota bacterium]